VPNDVFRVVSIRSTEKRLSADPTGFVERRGALAAVERAGRLWRRPDELAEASRRLPVLDLKEVIDTARWVPAVQAHLEELAKEDLKNPQAGDPPHVDDNQAGVATETAARRGDTTESTEGRLGRLRGRSRREGGADTSAPVAPTDLLEFASSTDFRDAYERLTASWLALALRERASQQVSRDLLQAHEEALRSALVLRSAAAGTLTVAEGHRLSRIPLIVPSRWRNLSSPDPALPVDRPDSQQTVPTRTLAESRSDKPAGDQPPPRTQRRTPSNWWRRRQLAPNMPTPSASYVVAEAGAPNATGAPRPLAELRAERATVVDQGHAMGEILVASTLIAAALGGEGGPARFDSKFRDALTAAVSEGSQPALKQLFRELHGFELAGDFTAGVDRGLLDKWWRANDLCQEIQVFEEESTQYLPKPRPVKAGPRPSIRAAGWGDLFVVREELAGYRAREISHIENALAGESTSRKHERRLEVREIVETETINETSSEDELQSTNRFELQAESARTISQDFTIDAGVNTSGKYGLTTVETSLGVGLTRSSDESTRSATSLAQEVTSRAVDRTRESARELRRRMTLETVKEISTHGLNNTLEGVGPNPQPRSGVYMWVEKLQQLQLYQYGKRLMIEFVIPEPGVSLLEVAQPVRPDVPKPRPLSFGPTDINEYNYLCLTRLYHARNVDPPPPLIIQIGDAIATESNDNQNATSPEASIAKMLTVPPDYLPIAGQFSTTGRGRTEKDIDPYHAHLSIGGQTILDSAVQLKDTADKEGRQSYQNSFVLTNPTMTDERGIPVAVRFSGHDDNTATMNVYLQCQRGSSALARWQLDTYQRLLEARDELDAQYRASVQQLRFAEPATATFGGRPAEQNREVERNELEKWAIKLMRAKVFDFDPIVGVNDVQEIDPAAADRQAPIVRFFQQCFEWDQMSYFLEPYFWARPESWRLRQRVSVPDDPRHEAFLKAGSARVLVPVTPGYEKWLLQYLSTDPVRPDWRADLVEDYDPLDPNQRIAPIASDLEAITEENVHHKQFEELWLELIEDTHPDVLRGAGRLHVRPGQADVELVGTEERVSEVDVGRELYIDGGRYEIVAVTVPPGEAKGTEFSLERPYEGVIEADVVYATGAVKRGPAWEVTVPTTLVILSSNRADLS